MCKIPENVVANQLCGSLQTNSLFEVFLSDFQKHHSKESVLVKVTYQGLHTLSVFKSNLKAFLFIEFIVVAGTGWPVVMLL